MNLFLFFYPRLSVPDFKVLAFFYCLLGMHPVRNHILFFLLFIFYFRILCCLFQKPWQSSRENYVQFVERHGIVNNIITFGLLGVINRYIILIKLKKGLLYFSITKQLDTNSLNICAYRRLHTERAETSDSFELIGTLSDNTYFASLHNVHSPNTFNSICSIQ